MWFKEIFYKERAQIKLNSRYYVLLKKYKKDKDK